MKTTLPTKLIKLTLGWDEGPQSVYVIENVIFYNLHKTYFKSYSNNNK